MLCGFIQIIKLVSRSVIYQLSGDGGLTQYDVVVLDEVHERHLHGDFLLGIMKCVIHQRTDMKLILMSATINIKLFSDYFAKEDVKVIQVSITQFCPQLLCKIYADPLRLSTVLSHHVHRN